MEGASGVVADFDVDNDTIFGYYTSRVKNFKINNLKAVLKFYDIKFRGSDKKAILLGLVHGLIYNSNLDLQEVNRIHRFLIEGERLGNVNRESAYAPDLATTASPARTPITAASNPYTLGVSSRRRRSRLLANANGSRSRGSRRGKHTHSARTTSGQDESDDELISNTLGLLDDVPEHLSEDEPSAPAPSVRKPFKLRAILDCSVCMETFPRERFPDDKITPDCNHNPEVCLQCVTDSIDADIQGTDWDQLSCPMCPAKLPFEVVKKFASQEAFERYDMKAVMSSFKDIPDFTMCLGPNCGSGQIHTGGDEQPIMTCTTCGFKTCYTHKLPWHAGETCSEYDARHRERLEQEEASAKALAETSKICPNPRCGLHVVKVSGCDHTTCHRCGHDFCYLCLASYDQIREVGNTAHEDSCPYHSSRLRGIGRIFTYY